MTTTMVPVAVWPWAGPASHPDAISIAATLSHYFIGQKRAVGLVGAGRSATVIPAERSDRLESKILETLAFFEDDGSSNKRLPSLIQYMWYVKRDEIQFIVGDVGMGNKRHLSQTYPELEDDEQALRKAIQPQVSGTFGKSDPYTNKNNAGIWINPPPPTTGD